MGLFSRNSEPLRRTLQRWLRRPIALRTRAWLYLVLVTLSGALGGLLWHSMVELPTYSVSENGSAQITERSLGQVFATDGVYVIIGMLAGLAIGFAAWRLFDRLGWPVTLVAVGGGLVSGGICWLVGISLGPRNFANRINAAQPGQLVSIDFRLHTTPALFVWALGAIIPIMLYANLSRELEPEPRRSGGGAPKNREPGAGQRDEILGGQFDDQSTPPARDPDRGFAGSRRVDPGWQAGELLDG